MPLSSTADSPVISGPVPATPDDILARARAVAPVLAERANEIEEARRLPEDIVELLRGSGVFRMAFPESWGGPALTPVQQTEVIEALATGDASAAWCVMVGQDSGLFAGFMAPSAAREIFPSLDLITAGAIPPKGRAERVPGGYRVTGDWQFGSGITHCDRVVAGVLVYRDGEPEPNPLPVGGRAHWRMIVARPEQFELSDTWFTTGLAGSGSLDYKAENLFIPEEHTFSFAAPAVPGPAATPDSILRPMPGVPLGVARAALDYVRTMAERRVDRPTRQPWPQNYRVQMAIAQCEMDLVVARHAVYGTLRRQWELLCSGAEITLDERVAVALARVNAFRAARKIVSTLFDLVTTTAIYRPSPLDRWLRDLNTMCQHATVQDQILQSAGAVLLGGKPQNPIALGLPE
ncbi:acyl-CoA dehydrogenase family protein (plasmid) [Streptomyces sp. NBC_01340]|uniref:acyl-CoA dehydrogenase family protein n=1 Tax=unclassified Streptomyces TaxID=2593676 RepID=UPI00225890F2|nr:MULTISPECIES: acyl-CoA dehydrogenase family protein [unclassified Streptomyces]MCX4458636.1 acyl-CoA dehydrogenase family protein [Streptomyces sp. NBC_01719]MCX4460481.1 acyl-CoA dehydrogenase family protein [Streptomyces sp. NBC_01719]MCX4497993.1 acyl-CoA dehydrogenase family protein [Streptomyces sp. NBC_01728]MCX4500189.1 acyl-CoA dehydrogenase family protein [Streptomyces sp. NBC_01728]WSI45270.1 acyl-CoA dehydrogenase family protein [Streptomyces sp. NBC_01340]